MQALVRSAFSGSRKRYHDDNYDLDLTYITPRLIAMGFPASGIEKTFRNDINEVEQFMDARHPDHYFVVNLSGKRYETDRFHGRAVSYGFPDHHPPPLDFLCQIVHRIHTYLQEHPENVCAVHCLAGKGRTGVIISCVMLYLGEYGSLKSIVNREDIEFLTRKIINDFIKKRGEGVGFPSQARYIHYFIRFLRSLEDMPIPKALTLPPPSNTRILQSITFNCIPNFDATSVGGCTPILQIMEAPCEQRNNDLIYSTAWEKEIYPTYTPESHREIVFEINKEIKGDILIRCFHGTELGILGRHTMQMFHLTFHVDYLDISSEGQYVFWKEEIDGASSCARFPDTFNIQLNFGSSESRLLKKLLSSDQPGVSSPLQEAKSVGNSLSLYSGPSGHVSTPTMGWLIKQGGFIKTWKRRWFVLRDQKIAYFKKDADPSPIGTVSVLNIHLETCTCMEVQGPEMNYHYFKVIPLDDRKRTYVLGAISETDMTRWINAIAHQSSRLQWPVVAPLKHETPRSAEESHNLFGIPMETSSPKKPKKLTLKSLVQHELVELYKEEEHRDDEDNQSLRKSILGFYTRDELEAMENIRRNIDNKETVMGSFTEFQRLEKGNRDVAIAVLADLIINRYPILSDALEENPYGLLQIICYAAERN